MAVFHQHQQALSSDAEVCLSLPEFASQVTGLIEGDHFILTISKTGDF
jgi:hypothetical protein